MFEERAALQLEAGAAAGKRRLPSWRETNWDTSPEAEAVLFKLWRETPPGINWR